MKCTEMLINEHSIILDRLDKIEALLTKLPSVDRREFSIFFEFVKEYVDEFHHNKEEGFYFKWMIKRNPTMEHGPIACMLFEHQEGRDLITDSENDLKKNDIVSFESNLKAFIVHLRDHIEKENSLLYKMADDIDSETKDGDSILMPAFNDINENLKHTPLKFGIVEKDANSGCCGSCT